MAITNLAEFTDYVKLMLGMPVVNVEIADTQIAQCVSDAIDEFTRYSYGEGLYQDFIMVDLSAGVSAYPVSSAVSDAIDISLSFGDRGIGDINTLFSPSHLLLYNDWIAGGYPGGNYGSQGAGFGGQGQAGLGGSMMLSNFMVTLTYLEEIKNLFSKKYVVDYISTRNEIRITPTPQQSQRAMINVWKREDAANLYNHILVKKLALAKCRYLLGWHLYKYEMTLPGGGRLNGQRMMDDGAAQEEKILDDIRMQTEPPGFEVG